MIIVFETCTPEDLVVIIYVLRTVYRFDAAARHIYCTYCRIGVNWRVARVDINFIFVFNFAPWNE